MFLQMLRYKKEWCLVALLFFISSNAMDDELSGSVVLVDSVELTDSTFDLLTDSNIDEDIEAIGRHMDDTLKSWSAAQNDSDKQPIPFKIVRAFNDLAPRNHDSAPNRDDKIDWVAEVLGKNDASSHKLLDNAAFRSELKNLHNGLLTFHRRTVQDSVNDAVINDPFAKSLYENS